MTPTVFIVDDEQPVGDSIAMLLSTVGIETRVYREARAFLDDYTADQPGCLLLDVRMPRMSGLELQQELVRHNVALPVIFITGHGDVPMAVEAMRAGALDFLQKPFKDDDLIRRVQKALEQDARERADLRQRDALRRRFEELTPREREVGQRIAAGEANKVVALELGLSERTVELHRANLMQKLGLRNLAQLVQFMLQVGRE
jgi:two-component system, LuxR family, response regulator FixJ